MLENKIALITGGSNGIGEAIAHRFIEEGARIIVFDKEQPGYDSKYYRVDVRSDTNITKAVSKLDVVDILVNSAGVYLQARVEQTTADELDMVIDTNLKGTFLVCKYVLPQLLEHQGNVINIASGLGQTPEPASAAYCASKAGIIMLTQCMALEYAPQNVRVNAILPGPIDTKMLREALASQGEFDAYAQLNPMKRIGTAQDVANMAAFLASDQASYVTGGLFAVDGGESIAGPYT